MSFTEQPTFGSWRHIGCFLLGISLSLVTLVVAAVWYLSFWDLSSDTYRAVTIVDFVVVPGTLAGSILILRLYFQKFMRD